MISIMSICLHCRNATTTMSAGQICCAECSNEVRCAACLSVVGARYTMEYFGDDPICAQCLPEVVADALDEDDEDDPDYVPPGSETETESSESEADSDASA